MERFIQGQALVVQGIQTDAAETTGRHSLFNDHYTLRPVEYQELYKVLVLSPCLGGLHSHKEPPVTTHKLSIQVVGVIVS